MRYHKLYVLLRYVNYKGVAMTLSVIQERIWSRLEDKANGNMFKKEISISEFQEALKGYRIESKDLWFAIAKELESEGIIEFVDGHKHINQNTRLKIRIMPKGYTQFKAVAFFVLLFCAATLLSYFTVMVNI